MKKKGKVIPRREGEKVAEGLPEGVGTESALRETSGVARKRKTNGRVATRPREKAAEKRM